MLRSNTMGKVAALSVAIFLACPLFGANQSREQKRLEACGQVFKEIMNIPDGLPKDLLSYSRSRGLFAGISLEGSTLRSDGSANKKLYGRSLSAKEIVREGKVGVPASGRELVSLLDKKSPKNESDPVSLNE